MAFSPGNKSYAAENHNNTNQIKGVVTNYFNGDICTIDISKDDKYSFNIDPNIVSSELDNHIITLKKTNNKWLTN